MKKFLLVCVVLCVGLFLYLRQYALMPLQDINVPTVSLPSPTTSILYNTVTLQGEEFAIGFAVVDDVSAVNLESNLNDKQITRNIVDQKGCTYLTNAGFYTKENTHTGLFISNGQRFRNARESMLFDGFVSISQSNKLTIDSKVNEDQAKHAVQTGPLLMTNSSVHSLQIRNDEYARRVVAAKSATGQMVLLVFFSSRSVFDGPKLAQMPALVKIASDEYNLSLTHAINLDGGSASAFYSPEIELEEISPVGSYFCITSQ